MANDTVDTMTRRQRRMLTNRIILSISGMAAMLGLIMLIWILGDVAIRGISAINWDFFTQLPAPPGVKGGGLANDIVGTLLMTVVATLMSVPFGVLAGTWLSEFGRDHILGHMVRYLSDILVSAPSIVIGVFVYLIMVKTNSPHMP